MVAFPEAIHDVYHEVLLVVGGELGVDEFVNGDEEGLEIGKEGGEFPGLVEGDEEDDFGVGFPGALDFGGVAVLTPEAEAEVLLGKGELERSRERGAVGLFDGPGEGFDEFGDFPPGIRRAIGLPQLGEEGIDGGGLLRKGDGGVSEVVGGGGGGVLMGGEGF